MGWQEIVLAIFGFGAIIFVHELGHFLSAKVVGVKVEEFMLGLPGPKLISEQVGETKYGITAIPFGGYVKFAGDELKPPEETEELSEEEKKRQFNYQPLWKKSLVITSGVLMNVFFAILIGTVLFMQGVPSLTTTIELVMPGTPAVEAGLRPNDKIVSVNGVKVKEWEEVTKIIQLRPRQTVMLVILRDGRTKDFSIKLTERKGGKGYLGIQSKFGTKRYNFLSALYISTVKTVVALYVISAAIIKLLLTPSQFLSMGRSPLGIGVEMARAAREGTMYFLELLAGINIGIAIINFFPLPPLDGGRLLIYVVEKVRKKTFSPERSLAINVAGAAVLIALVAYLFVADVGRYLVPFLRSKVLF